MSTAHNVDIGTNALFVPAMAPLYSAVAALGYPLIRVALGLMLLPHGFAKVFLDDAVPTSRHFVHFGWPHPVGWAVALGALEFFGGLMLALGLFTRIVAAAFVIEMAVISLAILYPQWDWGRHGMEYCVFMGAVAFGILLRGGEHCSLDRLIGREF